MKKFLLNDSNVEYIAGILAEVLNADGSVVLLPTETVYGLVARAGDEAAIKRIYELKHREAAKRLGWFIGDWRKLPQYGVILDGLPEQLAGAYCPGALTVIAPCADGSTQGFRVPDTPLLKLLLAKMDVPLVQTSANASGMPDARSCGEALEQLSGEVDCAVDGGSIPEGATGSTVVDACGKKIKILRQGPVDLQKWI
ncbi:MAG: Sua5/YciO/YrdC/YwlC family protein [Lentisphaerae bacterium]|nr:Sua5/YciO/YrdC/YwlC family protein [Lentisphaerota bacterium]